MSSRKVTIAVDEQFFKNIFEKQRKQLQNQLGIINLSQPNFTKMIRGLKVIVPKKEVSNFKTKRKKRNDMLKI